MERVFGVVKRSPRLLLDRRDLIPVDEESRKPKLMWLMLLLPAIQIWKDIDGIYTYTILTYKLTNIRPHQAESSGSRPISTENLFRGQLVVGWVTTSEYWLLYVFAFFLCFDSINGEMPAYKTLMMGYDSLQHLIYLED